MLLLLSMMAFIAGLINFNVNVNAPKAIALCWVIFNSIPHIILLTYARIGPGKRLVWVCSLLMWLSFFVSTAALVCLWVLYPREEDYVKAAGAHIPLSAALELNRIALSVGLELKRVSSCLQLVCLWLLYPREEDYVDYVKAAGARIPLSVALEILVELNRVALSVGLELNRFLFVSTAALVCL